MQLYSFWQKQSQRHTNDAGTIARTVTLCGVTSCRARFGAPCVDCLSRRAMRKGSGTTCPQASILRQPQVEYAPNYRANRNAGLSR